MKLPRAMALPDSNGADACGSDTEHNGADVRGGA
jgi:hypothetical protein